MKQFISIILLSALGLNLFSQHTLKISGGNLKVTGDVNIILKDAKWINNASFYAQDGTVTLTGTAAQTNASIEGTSETEFFNLTIDKSSNNAEINQNITIENIVTLTNGNLELNNHCLTINGNYTLQNAHYFQTSGTGSLKREVSSEASMTFPVGNGTYTPMTIQNDGTTDVFSVRTTPEVLENGTSGNALTTDVVDRTWFVEEVVAGGSDLTLTAQWNASDELLGFDRNDCAISHYTSSWDMPGGAAASGSNPYTISRSGITSLSPFAVFTEFVLPIELVDFYVFREGENVRLEWKTATEINSDKFEIEHSTDAFSFKKIGEVQAATFSNSELNYDFLHQNPFDPKGASGINYYRLKMKDLDGSFEYSEVRSVDLLNFQSLVNLVTVYPNPTSDILNIRFNENMEAGRLEMYNELGQKFLERDLNHPSKYTILVRDFPSGVYFLNVKRDGKCVIKRIIVSKH